MTVLQRETAAAGALRQPARKRCSSAIRSSTRLVHPEESFAQSEGSGTRLAGDSGSVSGTRRALLCPVDGRSRTEVEKTGRRADAVGRSRDSALKLTPRVGRLSPLRS